MNSKSPKSFWAALAMFVMAPVSLASAADFEQPTADADFDWSGFYMGVGISSQGSGIDFAGVGKKGDLDIKDEHTGFSGIVGYNYMAGSWVLGVESSLGSAGFKESKAVTGLGTITAESDWLATMQLRGGYAFDNLLLYGTAGLALQDLEMTSTLGGKYDKTLAGGVFGIGAEYAMSNSWAIRAEALALTFKDDATLNGSKRKFDLGDGIVRLGVTHKF